MPIKDSSTYSSKQLTSEVTEASWLWQLTTRLNRCKSAEDVLQAAADQLAEFLKPAAAAVAVDGKLLGDSSSKQGSVWLGEQKVSKLTIKTLGAIPAEFKPRQSWEASGYGQVIIAPINSARRQLATI